LFQLAKTQEVKNYMYSQMKDAPVEEGKTYEVDIKELSRRGDGLARVEGFVVFVPNTNPGDHVKIQVTQVRDRFAIAEKAE
jgi:predicted RNA-binding protein with TRAM domain